MAHIAKPKNGAQLLGFMETYDSAHAVVLCKYGQEYVTWVMDGEGNCFWGNYHTEYLGARQNFIERCKRYEGQAII